MERTDSAMKSTPMQMIESTSPLLAICTAASPMASESAMNTCGHFSDASVPWGGHKGNRRLSLPGGRGLKVGR